MKTKLSGLFLALIFFSCKKTENTKVEVNYPISVEKEVDAWLKSQQSDKTPIKNTIIDLLKNNLDFSGLSIEELNQEEKLIIIPLSSTLKLSHHKDKLPINILLFILDKTGNIRKGNIVQYLPDNSSLTNIPTNTFSNFYNSGKLSDGIYTFLTIGDNFLEEYIYKDGRMYSYKLINKKTLNLSARQTCIHWTLVTTIFYTDGTTETFTEDLGTTCYGSCAPNELCDELEDGGGGSGSSSDEPQEDQLKTWFIENPYWYVKSSERISGTKNADVPNGGYFTGISNIGYTIHSINNVYSLTENSCNTGYSPNLAKSTIYGKVSNASSNTLVTYLVPPNNSKSWTFSQVFL